MLVKEIVFNFTSITPNGCHKKCECVYFSSSSIHDYTLSDRHFSSFFFNTFICNTKTHISEIKHIHKAIILMWKRMFCFLKAFFATINKERANWNLCIYDADRKKKGEQNMMCRFGTWIDGIPCSISSHQIGYTWHLCLMEYTIKKRKIDFMFITRPETSRCE